MSAGPPLSTLLSQVLIAFTIELDNEFELRLAKTGLRARVVSVVMWSNFLRLVGDGLTVDELPDMVGMTKPRALSTLGGMERWGYVSVGPESAGRRDGYGSARGLRNDWVVRPTAAGRAAQGIWPALVAEIEARWEKRFGRDTIDELRESLRAIVGRLEVELPEYLPIVGSSTGMVAEVSARERRDLQSGLHLSTLLAQVLLAYTLDFERESELSLPLSADVVRVLDERGTPVRDLPLAAGVSKEAIAMAVTVLRKSGHVAVEGATKATSVAQLTTKGRDAQDRAERLHAELERAWKEQFGADEVRRLRASLQGLREHKRFVQGLEPPPGGWRWDKRYVVQTEAVLESPSAALPHYPMVLHRGGWPDGS